MLYLHENIMKYTYVASSSSDLNEGTELELADAHQTSMTFLAFVVKHKTRIDLLQVVVDLLPEAGRTPSCNRDGLASRHIARWQLNGLLSARELNR